MIRQLLELNENICVLVTCTDSSYVDVLTRDALKKRFNVDSNYTMEVTKEKELREAKKVIVVPPMMGDRWLIAIDGDSITFSQFVEFFKTITNNAICYIRCKKYATFKRIISIKALKEHTSNVMYKYYNRLSSMEIEEIYKFILMNSKNRLNKELLGYVCSAYRYDVGSACDLFYRIKSGEEFENKSDVIDAIGVGGNTIEYTVVQLLTISVNTDRGYKRAVAKILGLIKDLRTKYDYNSIYNMINSTVDRFITLKELFIAGKYRDKFKDYGSRASEKEIQQLKRLNRYSWVIKDKASMQRILSLKMCLMKHKEFNAEVSLVMCISDYLYAVRHDKMIVSEVV